MTFKVKQEEGEKSDSQTGGRKEREDFFKTVTWLPE